MVALSSRALELGRRAFGALVVLSVFERWGVLRSCYSDEGVLPVAQWRSEVLWSPVHLVLCVHAWSGAVVWQRLLSVAQVGFGVALAGDVAPRASALASLWLYASATARHARLAFILDRYAHIALLWVVLAPEAPSSRAGACAAVLYRAQLCWIYLDAGWAKFTDVDRGRARGRKRAANFKPLLSRSLSTRFG